MSATASELEVIKGREAAPEDHQPEAPVAAPTKVAKEKKIKAAPRGSAIMPEKRKAAITEVTGDHVYVVTCVGTEHSPYPQNAGLTAIIVAGSKQPFAPGKIFDLHHATSKINLGQYKLVAKKDLDEKTKLRLWSA